MESSILERNDNHHKIFHSIRNYLEDETLDTVYIAVAFLTVGGFNLIRDALIKALDNGAKLSIIAGTDFFQTDPQSLRSLFELLDSRDGCVLGIMSAAKHQVFHPKLYCFGLVETGVISIGSANLTGGGLNSNDELSITVTVSKDSEEWQSIMRTFESYTESNRFWKLNEDVLSEYEEAHQNASPQLSKNNQLVDDFEPAPRRRSKWFSLTNTENLKTLLNRYRESGPASEYYLRTKRNYSKAHEHIEDLVKEIQASPKWLNFRPQAIAAYNHLAFDYWASDGIYGQAWRVLDNPKPFVDLLKMLSDNPEGTARKLFDTALRIGRGHGIGPNAVSETMHTMYPSKFCVVNSRTAKVLARFGWRGKKSSSSFNGQDYSEFNEAMIVFKDFCKFESLNQTDAFLYFTTGRSLAEPVRDIRVTY